MAAKGPTITYTKGDSSPFNLLLSRAGSAFDLTGFTALEIVTNTDEQPVDNSNEQFRLPGTIVAPATDGRLSFQPAGADPAARAAESRSWTANEEGYFYDLSGLDGSGERVTLLNGGLFIVKEDINKA